MMKSLCFIALAVVLGGCAYSPTPGPSLPAVPGGYTVNDNGYQAYYSTKAYPNPDCKNGLTWRCSDRLDYDAAFCAGWETSGRCGDSAVTREESKEISPAPPAGREWLW
ncbi:MAG: hypothetical protein GC190_14825 [Alphaproteobacteria bacterium]|nr:hypothetical protein [Alphaproteobacteria bacterium]